MKHFEDRGEEHLIEKEQFERSLNERALAEEWVVNLARNRRTSREEQIYQSPNELTALQASLLTNEEEFKEKSESDKEGETKTWKIDFEFTVTQDIEQGDPEFIALRSYFAKLFDTDISDYRVENCIAAGFDWLYEFPAQKAGSQINSSLTKNILVSALTYAYETPTPGTLEILKNWLLQLEQPLTSNQLAEVMKLAPIYASFTEVDKQYYNEWKDKTYPDEYHLRIGYMTPESLERHREVLVEFYTNKLSLLAKAGILHKFSVKGNKRDGKGSAEPHPERIKKLEKILERVNRIPNKLLADLLAATSGNTFTHPRYNDDYGDKKKAGSLEYRFEKAGLNISDPFDFVVLFQEIAIGQAFEMLWYNRRELKKEEELFESDKHARKFYNFIHKNFEPRFDEANLLRARATVRYLNHIVSKNALALLGFGFHTSIILAKSKLGDIKQVAEYIGSMAPKTLLLELVDIQVANNRDLTLDLAYKGNPKLALNQLMEFDSRFKKADEMDQETVLDMQEKGTSKFGILKDISIDFRIASQLNQTDFIAFVRETIDEKIENNKKVTTKLNGDPEVVWKFELLIDKTKEDLGIGPKSAGGKIISDVYQDKANREFWEGAGIAALGIALGVAGFFTGGTTWAGLALLGGSLALSGYELYQSVKEYQFQDAAQNTALDSLNELSNNQPSVLTIVLSAVGLLIDAGALFKAVKVLKAGAPLGKGAAEAGAYTAREIKAVQEGFAELAEAAAKGNAKLRAEAIKKIYKALGKSRLKGGMSLEEFTEQLNKNLAKNKESDTKMLAQFSELGIKGDLLYNLSHSGLLQSGFRQLFEANPEATKRLLKYFADDPKLIYHFSMESLTSPHFAENFSHLSRLLSHHDDYLKVISYLGRSGRAGLPTLNQTLELITKGGITDSHLVSEILTDGSLRSVLRQLDDPAELKSLWNEFLEEKPSSRFTDFARNKAQFLSKRKKLRDIYMGETPGKDSKTGKEVIERMRAEGKIIEDIDGNIQFKSSDGNWYDLREADMSHKVDAVSWWNKTGRKYGAKSQEVRDWMLDSKNYELEYYKTNRSRGGASKETYLDPLKLNEK